MKENEKVIDWMIHYVQEHDCEICGKHNKNHVGFTGFANIHTHGLNLYNHKELCIPLDIGFKLAGTILNQCGLRIKLKNEKFVPDKDYSVIQNLPVLFYEFDNSDTLYMIMPDPNGKFPDDDGCEFPYNKQILYAKIIEEDK